MDKTEFLKISQRVAVLSGDVLGIKKDIPKQLLVSLDGIPYYPIGRICKFDKSGKQIYTAMLHDLKSNCIVHCPIEEVKNYES